MVYASDDLAYVRKRSKFVILGVTSRFCRIGVLDKWVLRMERHRGTLEYSCRSDDPGSSGRGRVAIWTSNVPCRNCDPILGVISDSPLSIVDGTGTMLEYPLCLPHSSPLAFKSMSVANTWIEHVLKLEWQELSHLPVDFTQSDKGTLAASDMSNILPRYRVLSVKNIPSRNTQNTHVNILDP